MQQSARPGTSSPRNIVLFSDGTGNSAGKLFRTNVWRTYQALDLKDPQQPLQPRQFALYDDGVGTSSFKPLAVVGGAVGFGLARNVRDLYAFVCRTYRPAGAVSPDQPADRIYGFGFSRGAFTIRVLMGLILTQGLVEYDGDEAKLERDVAAAWRQYRRERYTSAWPFVDLFRGARDAVIRIRNGLMRYQSYAQVTRIGTPYGLNGDPIEIEFLGLWDTVDAYGLPVDELTRAIDQVFWPLSMPNYNLDPRVRRAMHALSLDDERNAFHPRPWNEGPADVVRAGQQEPPAPGEPWQDRSRISQVWFAGVHSNVGGGYPDDGLSYVPLMWILRGAEIAGLRLEPQIVAEYTALADENGPIYDSRKGLGSYYRYNPRRIANVLAKNELTVQAVKVHESAFRRIRAGLDGYAPIVLPPSFEVVKIDGEFVEGAGYLGQPGTPILPKETELVWNWVWRRRVAYFLTLGLTLALLAMPLYAPTAPGGACTSTFCFLATPMGWLAALLPSFAGTWLNVFQANPGWSTILSLAILAGMLAGSALSVAISDRMRLAWYNLTPLRPAGITPAPVRPMRGFEAALHRFRCSRLYHGVNWWMSQRILPGVFVVLVAYAGIALTTRVALAVSESVGGVCYENGSRRADETILTRRSCNATPFRLERGGVYRLRLRITEPWTWADGPAPVGGTAVPASPNGILRNAAPWYMPAGVPLRRHLVEPWFRMIARIGERGTDSYSLVWRRMDSPSGSDVPAEPGQVWEAIITAGSTGRLFLYVNDATLYPLFAPFYSSNKGAAALEVEAAVGAT
ncbi:DUF2235 domain-containing protein [Enterovirga sp. CN4-39]|uniref:DUF2235 domain-containing protein n=1 Tax=Enterovirga sp. CN4-39 TaxID=3400910 RepID=UPI003C119C07